MSENNGDLITKPILHEEDKLTIGKVTWFGFGFRGVADASDLLGQNSTILNGKEWIETKVNGG